MIKVLLVSTAVILSVANAHEAHADSASVVITHIQAGGVGAATQEFIAIYNNSTQEVNITDWCIQNKNNLTVTCFDDPSGRTIYLPPFQYAVAASASLAALTPNEVPTKIFSPLSPNSGSITGSADTISLIDHNGDLIDRKAWVSPLTGGSRFVRRSTLIDPVIYGNGGAQSDWMITIETIVPVSGTFVDAVVIDACPNIEGDQLLIPTGQRLNETGECVDRVIVVVQITELLPNAEGSDAGKEFIELYNPNDFAVNLSDYLLLVGPQLDSSYQFPSDSVIEPKSYSSFSNSDIPYSLLNSSSRASIVLSDGTIVSESPRYQDPKDDRSWAMIDGEWQYTSFPTPGLENVLVANVIPIAQVIVVTPCAANQYRSLETNRCRLVSTPLARVTPCKDGQYRSEETNRCRNIATVSTPAPCAEGQERNPETNRCRVVKKMPSVEYGVLGVTAKNDGNWYALMAVGGVVIVALAYAVWEWHVEIGKFCRSTYARMLRLVRIHK
jgi:hypothetical protein